MSRGRLLAIALLVVLAGLSWLARRTIIRAFFPDGRPGAVAALTGGQGEDLDRAGRVRVVVLDGLSRSAAVQLPALSELCARGLDVAVDVGFPTVSLPVQHVLWTGRTQQQSGVLYRVRRLETPPPGALPALVPDAHAVAESHRDIVHSFGFATADPALDREEIEPAGSTWRTAEFEATAAAAVGGPESLVFVHVLRIDEAGHASGGVSPEYRSAAAQADRILGALVERAPPDRDTRWFVLADHGHLPGGGHGDAEAAIRIVRACIVGGVEPELARWPIHLVDLHRALAASLGLTVADDARGRPLSVANAEPDLGATLPRAPSWRVAVALASMLGGVALAIRGARRMSSVAPAWPLVAFAGLLALHGWPSLSSPPVFPPFARDLLLALSPGFVVAALAAGRSRAPVRDVAIGLLAAPVAGFVGVCIWIGVDRALAGGPPPLLPFVSAQASVLAAVDLGGAVAVALGLAVAAVRRVGS